jgi:nucleoside-diphosphate-sugar epimerase
MRGGPSDQNLPKAVIIGASGFVGSAIVRHAAASHDLRPIACMRTPSQELDAIGVETRTCDATDPTALARVLEGAKYAVNCVLGSRSSMVNVTRNLCLAARRLHVQRIVHMSSMAVYGRATGLVDESVRPEPVSAYARAKAECEIIVRDFIAASGDAVVLRPGCVYGPGGQQWVGRIARWLRAGRLGELGELADGYCNLTFNDDLAHAVTAALTTPAAAGGIFNIVDLEIPDLGTWNQYFVYLGREIGVPVRRIPRLQMSMEAAIIAPPLQVAKIIGSRVGMLPGRIPEPITPSLLALWRQRVRLDHRRAGATLAFPRTPPRRGLALSADWFRSVASI